MKRFFLFLGGDTEHILCVFINCFSFHRKMNSLNNVLQEEMYVLFGLQVVNVTLLDVIVQIYSHQMRMVGFGLAQV